MSVQSSHFICAGDGLRLAAINEPAGCSRIKSRCWKTATAVFTAIDFVSNIETIGVAVSGTGLPSTAELSYRRSGETLWHSGSWAHAD